MFCTIISHIQCFTLQSSNVFCAEIRLSGVCKDLSRSLWASSQLRRVCALFSFSVISSKRCSRSCIWKLQKYLTYLNLEVGRNRVPPSMTKFEITVFCLNNTLKVNIKSIQNINVLKGNKALWNLELAACGREKLGALSTWARSYRVWKSHLP